MEKEKIRVIASTQFNNNLLLIHDYGTETFGLKQADLFILAIYKEIDRLGTHYEMHPECRYLITKSQKYRNIIIGSYRVIYRISDRVEILTIQHGSRSTRAIRKARSIRI